MSNFRHSDPVPRRAARPDSDSSSGYVSDYARFMDEFLRVHPDVVSDQHTGWDIYWDKGVDFKALAEEREDSVSAERFYYFGSPHYQKWLPGGGH